LRLDAEAEGAGLGLTIVRDIIDAYKGELTLGRSELGGLRVALVFPRAGEGEGSAMPRR
jgi:signal transduction histidine kinase